MNWNKPENRDLVNAFLSLQSEEEARRFLRDLLTPEEIEEFAKRLKAAAMLIDKRPYSEIQKKTGLSSTTVARVSKWLNGKEAGYKTILSRLHHRRALARMG
ncbi:MAG: TrpR-like protein YerC/YecD [Candidatus Kaiserbacteria bacterium]|nr:TrpR-like protein YerC/YecD [Candidatus Kaiserbacteria bacterium]